MQIKGSGSTDIGDLELLTLGNKADFSESNYVLHLSRFTLVAEIFGLPQRASSRDAKISPKTGTGTGPVTAHHELGPASGPATCGRTGQARHAAVCMSTAAYI